MCWLRGRSRISGKRCRMIELDSIDKDCHKIMAWITRQKTLMTNNFATARRNGDLIQ